MTQIELIGKIKEEIENLTHIAAQNAGLSNDKYEDGQIDAYGLILSFIESLEQSIDADKMIGLDEAVWEQMENDGDVDHFVRKELDEIALKYARLGAKWMAEQYKTLGETEIYLEDDGEAPYTQEWLDLETTEFAIPEGFHPGDKVIVQIRKK